MCCVPRIIDSLASLFPHKETTTFLAAEAPHELCLGSGQVHWVLRDILKIIMKCMIFGALRWLLWRFMSSVISSHMIWWWPPFQMNRLSLFSWWSLMARGISGGGGTRGSVVVKILCYKPEGRGYEIRWGEWMFSTYLILLVELGPGVYSESNRNEYQKQKNNVSGE
jgi:hypothetical protein